MKDVRLWPDSSFVNELESTSRNRRQKTMKDKPQIIFYAVKAESKENKYILRVRDVASGIRKAPSELNDVITRLSNNNDALSRLVTLRLLKELNEFEELR